LKVKKEFIRNKFTFPSLFSLLEGFGDGFQQAGRVEILLWAEGGIVI
jgi:site-specific DNA-cytosine methylase